MPHLQLIHFEKRQNLNGANYPIISGITHPNDRLTGLGVMCTDLLEFALQLRKVPENLS